MGSSSHNSEKRMQSDAIEALRALIVQDVPTYHAFSYCGDHLLYDLCTGSIV